MSIETRNIGKWTYVTETYRDGQKVVKNHLGTPDNPVLAFLLRASRYQAAIKQRLNADKTSRQKASSAIEPVMDRLLQCLGDLETICKANARVRHPNQKNFLASSPQEDHAVAKINKKVTTTTKSDLNRKSKKKVSKKTSKKTTKTTARRTSGVKPQKRTVKAQKQTQQQPQKQTQQPAEISGYESLPSADEFAEFCRRAELGDPRSIEIVEKLVDQAPQLLDAISDLIELAKKLVIEDTSGNSVLMAMGLHKRLQDNIKELKAQRNGDLVHAMNAEILVLSQLDAMRCALQACKRYDSQLEAERSQKLAERSQKRFERAQAVFAGYLSRVRQEAAQEL